MRKVLLVSAVFLLGVVVCEAQQIAEPLVQASAAVDPIIPPVLPLNALPSVPEPQEIPAWLQQLMTIGMALPVVGPYLVKIMQYLGIVVSLTTTACAFALSVLKILQGVSSVAGLSAFAATIEKFQNGKIMFFLKYASVFNAQKKAAPVAAEIKQDIPAAKSA